MSAKNNQPAKNKKGQATKNAMNVQKIKPVVVKHIMNNQIKSIYEIKVRAHCSKLLGSHSKRIFNSIFFPPITQIIKALLSSKILFYISLLQNLTFDVRFSKSLKIDQNHFVCLQRQISLQTKNPFKLFSQNLNFFFPSKIV